MGMTDLSKVELDGLFVLESDLDPEERSNLAVVREKLKTHFTFF